MSRVLVVNRDEFIKDVTAESLEYVDPMLLHNLLRQARLMRQEPWWFVKPTNEYRDIPTDGVEVVVGEINGPHVEGFDS